MAKKRKRASVDFDAGGMTISDAIWLVLTLNFVVFLIMLPLFHYMWPDTWPDIWKIWR